ncbi:MAG: YfcE family phosphodiesterase [Promethearchaeota archaeon]
MRACVIGDSHVPRRAKDIPELIKNKIIELTNKELFDYTFFTGDLVKAPQILEFLNNRTKKNVFIVIGNMDYFDGNRDAPLYQKLKLKLKDGNDLIIGLTHGAQISPRGDHAQLELLAAERGYHILISGHTHHEEIHLTENGTLLLNPGSCTGAWSFVASGIPSFITLKIEENSNHIIVVLYQLKNNKQIFETIYEFMFENGKIHRRI